MTQKRTLVRVEKALREDIRWAIRSGLGWDPHTPAEEDSYGKRWVQNPRTGRCGVCAIGAHVIRRQPPLGVWSDFAQDAIAAAKSLRISSEDAIAIYTGVMQTQRPNEEDHGPWYMVAQRIRRYASTYKKTRNHHEARRAADKWCAL